VLRDSVLGQRYELEPFPLLSEDEYIDILIRQLEILPPEITVERVSGDPLPGGLLAPQWVLNKKKVLNHLKNELIRRDSCQGRKYNGKRNG
jgi:radical SAM superfamily enzyme